MKSRSSRYFYRNRLPPSVSNNDDKVYDASIGKGINTCATSGVVAWSDLGDDVLFLIMVRLGVLDFPAFSKVCKSWRSFTLSNRKRFMATRPPMSIFISNGAYERECYCYLTDFDGRMFKTITPHSAGRLCVGLTCGYLILFGERTSDFWLVNPITRHELHFPCVPLHIKVTPSSRFKAILVFSPAVSGWLFVLIKRSSSEIWFSVLGKGTWNRVSSTSPILDLHAFKGKIYTLNNWENTRDEYHMSELRLKPKPKLTPIGTNNFTKKNTILREFISCDEDLYVLQCISEDLFKVHKLDFGEVKWECPEKTKDYAFFVSHVYHSDAVKRESWWAGTDKNGQGRSNTAHMWYFPHESFNVHIIDE